MARLREPEGKFVKENRDSQRRARRHNPATVFRFTHKGKKHRAVLGCGDEDRVLMRIREDVLYCVSYHTGLDYVGVRAYEIGEELTCEEGGEMFFKSEEHYEELLGRDGLMKLSDNTIARRLIEWFESTHC